MSMKKEPSCRGLSHPMRKLRFGLLSKSVLGKISQSLQCLCISMNLLACCKKHARLWNTKTLSIRQTIAKILFWDWFTLEYSIWRSTDAQKEGSRNHTTLFSARRTKWRQKISVWSLSRWVTTHRFQQPTLKAHPGITKCGWTPTWNLFSGELPWKYSL